MTIAMETQTRQRPWWLTLIAGILGIILGIALMVNYTVPGMGLWTVAVFGVLGGIVLIIQAFRQRSA